MIQCPNCDKVGVEDVSGCLSCGFSVEKIEGFTCWAPELASVNSGEFFDPDKFKELFEIENSNFWFQARNELILWAMKIYFNETSSFAEIGCGTGFVLSALEKALPDAEVVGTELFINGLKLAVKRCPSVRLVQLDARRIPYREHFDVIGIFDVLEHINEDTTVLEQIGKALVPGGGVLITVPQHPWLWSPVDEAACHVRRYSASELHDKVISAGFEILRSTSFVSLLLPAMTAARFTAPSKAASGASTELRLNKHLNLLFRHIMAAERRLVQYGIDFAVGGSRLLVARKK
jgi:SAM-dependent methyltransferase